MTKVKNYTGRKKRLRAKNAKVSFLQYDNFFTFVIERLRYM